MREDGGFRLPAWIGEKVEKTATCSACSADFTYTTWTGHPDERTLCGPCQAQESQRLYDEDRERRRQEHEEQKRQERIDALTRSLSSRQQTYTFENFTPGPGTRAVWEAMRTDPHKSRWLIGPVGVGKTHLVTAAARVLAPEHDITFTDAHAMIDDIRRAELSRGDELPAGTSAERFARVDVLALDDLDKARMTDFALEKVYQVADARWENERTTIVTSNAKPSELAASLGQAIVSRLVGLCEVVHLDGADARIKR